MFYGVQTLIQLLPIQNQKSKTQNIQLSIPQLSITDYPRFAYRGMHLDCARHFWTIDFIKKYIDYLALHKFNTFHWHLTDDQGWRIEIKKYPELTSVGGWRNGTIIGRYPGTGNHGIKYGGFYTQEQIKEIVKYAADRYITVVPEIEMPGHASAAIAAYPELSCFPGEPTINYFPKQCKWSGDSSGKQVQQTWGVFDDVFCSGKENTFHFLEDVMDEVLALFPSKYIHVGGDECPKANWKRCPTCQQRIKDNRLKDEHELQSYFIQRMEKYLNKKGRTLIGWDEILEGGLAPNAAVMSWRGEQGGIDAAKQNHDVIMTPGNPVYFDHSQSENEDSVTIGGYNPIEKVYAYEPVPKELNDQQAKHILGAQANMWAEYMGNTKKAEYMLFPRIAALSEVLWSQKEKKNWSDFEKRLTEQFKRYDLWKVNYSKAYFDLNAEVNPNDDMKSVIWQVKSKLVCEYCNIKAIEEFTYEKDTEIIDTTAQYDITDITKIIKYVIEKKTMKAGSKGSRTLTGQNEISIPINQSKKVRAWQEMHIRRGQTIEQKFSFNKATVKKIILTNPASNKYPGDGPFTLVNGVQNEKGLAKAKEFLGFDGTDCEAIIDFAKEETINSVKVHVLDDQSSWIYPPALMKIYYSSDGINFIEALNAEGRKIIPGELVKDIEWSYFPSFKTRYLKVFIKNFGAIPEGKPGAGSKAWLFVAEIEVK